MEEDAAVNVSVTRSGAGGSGVTVTVRVSVSDDEAFSHFNVYEVVVVGVTISVPERDFAPLQPLDAVQVSA